MHIHEYNLQNTHSFTFIHSLCDCELYKPLSIQRVCLHHRARIINFNYHWSINKNAVFWWVSSSFKTQQDFIACILVHNDYTIRNVFPFSPSLLCMLMVHRRLSHHIAHHTRQPPICGSRDMHDCRTAYIYSELPCTHRGYFIKLNANRRQSSSVDTRCAASEDVAHIPCIYINGLSAEYKYRKNYLFMFCCCWTASAALFDVRTVCLYTMKNVCFDDTMIKRMHVEKKSSCAITSLWSH